MEKNEKKSIKGTKTEHNLLAAFAGESQARNRYTFYSEIARKEGFEQICAIFHETADNEREHARRFFSFLEGENVEINASYPTRIGTTAENLKAAASGEHEEWTHLYPSFAQTAKEEGFPQVGAAFDKIVEVEKRHEKRFLKLLENVDTQNVFSKKEKTEWKCRNCGYIHYGENTPKICPACIHPQAYFEIHCENY